MLYSLLGFVVEIIGLIYVYIFKVNKYITKLGSFIIISRECRYTTQTLNLTNTDFSTSFIAISCKTRRPRDLKKLFLKISPKKMENVIKHVCDCLRVNLKKTHEPCLFYWLNTTYMYICPLSSAASGPRICDEVIFLKLSMMLN